MAKLNIPNLLKLFSITTGKDSQGNTSVLPARFNPETGKVSPLNFTKNKGKEEKEFQKIWDFWIKNTYDSPDTLKNRVDRYHDLEFMYYNDPIASMAMDYLADETVSGEGEEQEIGVYAKNSSFEKEIKSFLDSRKIRGQLLRDIAFNLSIYGDSFLANNLDPVKGVEKLIPLSVYDIKQRLEFSLSKVIEIQASKNAYAQVLSKQSGLIDLYKQVLSTNDDITELFEEFLFGFALSQEIWVAPWSITHFRRYSSRSEFWPFGKPPFMHMIGPYRQFSSTLNLQAMARIASFPLKHFEVETEERMTEIEQWASVSQARQSYSNLGVSNSGKDEFTINDELWTPKGLIDVSIIENRMDIDKIGDLEMYQDRMIAASRVPKSVLPFGDGARLGSESGKALMQQSKVYARFVYANQRAILETISFLIKLHFSIIGKFDNEEFEISLPYPVTEENSEVLRAKNDTLRLAKDILDNLGTSLGMERDESLPIEVVKDVFSKYSFLDSEEIETWTKAYLDSKEETLSENRKTILTKRYFSLKETLLRDLHFESLKNTPKLFESVREGKHFYSSFIEKEEEKLLIEYLSNSKNKSKLKLNETVQIMSKKE